MKREETNHDNVSAHVDGRSEGRDILAANVDSNCGCQPAKALVSCIYDVPFLLHILVVVGFGIVCSVPHILQLPADKP